MCVYSCLYAKMQSLHFGQDITHSLFNCPNIYDNLFTLFFPFMYFPCHSVRSLGTFKIQVQELSCKLWILNKLSGIAITVCLVWNAGCCLHAVVLSDMVCLGETSCVMQLLPAAMSHLKLLHLTRLPMTMLLEIVSEWH